MRGGERATAAAASVLFDHLAAVAPPDELVGVAVRFLREPKGTGGDYRGLGRFAWVPATALAGLPESWGRVQTAELLEEWRWVHDDCGGPARCAGNRYLHGVWLPGVAMLRLVTCATPPVGRGGRFEELTGVLGLAVDLDVAERRPGDRRRYCPTIADGLAFLGRFAPTVTLDAGRRAGRRLAVRPARRSARRPGARPRPAGDGRSSRVCSAGGSSTLRRPTPPG